MAQLNSFDVTTGVDMQEVDNAVNQAQKEISQRYDFKGSKAEIDFKRADSMLVLVADSDFQMNSLFDVLQAKLIKRGVPVKNLDIGEIKPAGGDTVRREIKLKTALDSDTAKKVAAAIKDAKLKKVQAAIQGDQVRVSSPSSDCLSFTSRRTGSPPACSILPMSRFFTGTPRLISFDWSTSKSAVIWNSLSAASRNTPSVRLNSMLAFEPLKS